ncbi:MAG: carbohydrate kinase family protein [Chitinophagaceae bacterium]
MQKQVICIGAALVDELYSAKAPMLLATTNDADVHRSAGGVSRNVAHQLALLGIPVQLISVFGNDGDGDWLKTICTYSGIKLDAAITTNTLTGKYTGILNYDGSLFTALITHAALEYITPQHLEKHQQLLLEAAFIVADANITVEAVEWLSVFCKENNIPFILEPVSVPPASKFCNANLEGLYMVTPNEDELPVMCSNKNYTTTAQQANELLQRGVQKVWVHNGAHGSTLFTKEKTYHLPAPYVQNIKDCTGAGDGSLTGFITAQYLGKTDEQSLQIAHTLSAEILQVNGAIASHLKQEDLLQLVPKYY